MHFFDYVYYKCCQLYDKNGEREGAGISGLILLSTFQMLNLIFISGLIFQTFHYYSTFNISWLLVFIFILPILNGMRYNKLNYGVLKKRWESENIITKKKKETAVIIYALVSIITTIIIIIWRANN